MVTLFARYAVCLFQNCQNLCQGDYSVEVATGGTNIFSAALFPVNEQHSIRDVQANLFYGQYGL
jgi:hypothetical protein